MSNEPYLIETEVITHYRYNPDYGDSRICTCGHTYDRHFDPYEDNEAVGCKYCGCNDFVERSATPNSPGPWEKIILKLAKVLDNDNDRMLDIDGLRTAALYRGATHSEEYKVLETLCKKIHEERWESEQ